MHLNKNLEIFFKVIKRNLTDIQHPHKLINYGPFVKSLVHILSFVDRWLIIIMIFYKSLVKLIELSFISFGTGNCMLPYIYDIDEINLILLKRGCDSETE